MMQWRLAARDGGRHHGNQERQRRTVSWLDVLKSPDKNEHPEQPQACKNEEKVRENEYLIAGKYSRV